MVTMATAAVEQMFIDASFDSIDCILWMRQHAEVPVAAVGIYLGFVFTVPELLRRPYDLKYAFAIWNLFLSMFSLMGVTRIVPHLYTALAHEGFLFTVCTEPHSWYGRGPVGFWMTLFVLSKFPELGDTAFLVLRKKKVLFLHWYHHTTVLLYCWHAYTVLAAPGLWFAAMNFSVHAVMYFYFFMTNVGFAGLMRPLAPFITTIQILQMIGGITCLVTVAVMQNTGRFADCNVDPANWKLGLMMYVSYFLLFGWLFVQKYLPQQAPEAPEPISQSVTPSTRSPTSSVESFGSAAKDSSERSCKHLRVVTKGGC